MRFQLVWLIKSLFRLLKDFGIRLTDVSRERGWSWVGVRYFSFFISLFAFFCSRKGYFFSGETHEDCSFGGRVFIYWRQQIWIKWRTMCVSNRFVLLRSIFVFVWISSSCGWVLQPIRAQQTWNKTSLCSFASFYPFRGMSPSHNGFPVFPVEFNFEYVLCPRTIYLECLDWKHRNLCRSSRVRFKDFSIILREILYYGK